MRQQSYGEWTYEGGARSESLVVADGNPTRYKGERIRCVERAIFAKPGGTAGLFLIFSFLWVPFLAFFDCSLLGFIRGNLCKISGMYP